MTCAGVVIFFTFGDLKDNRDVQHVLPLKKTYFRGIRINRCDAIPVLDLDQYGRQLSLSELRVRLKNNGNYDVHSWLGERALGAVRLLNDW